MTTDYSKGRSRRGFFTALAFILLLDGTLVAPGRWVLAQNDVGPEAVWKQAVEYELFDCLSDADCSIDEFMSQRGASVAAIEFAKGRGYTEFLIGFEESGVVDLGRIYHPYTNYLLSYEMLNGTPRVVSTQDIGFTDESAIPQFATLLAKYPNLMFWPGATSPEVETKDDGTQRFTFLYPLLDGCHACEQVGWAKLGFDFDSNGIYQGIIYLDPLPFVSPTPVQDDELAGAGNTSQREEIQRLGVGLAIAIVLALFTGLGAIKYRRRG